MIFSLSQTNLLKKRFANLLESSDWLLMLQNGDFYSFEQNLHSAIMGLYDDFCSLCIKSVSQSKEFKKVQKKLAEELGLKKLVVRDFEIQLRTGTKVKHKGYYAKKRPDNYQGERRLSLLYWGCLKGASPMYQSITCLYSVICPSFDVAKQLMHHQGIKGNYDRIRSVSLALSSKCLSKRSEVQLRPEDSLSGKRVLIEMDGGRSRTRVYTGKLNENNQEEFETPWREPKMFVITVIDENGEIEKDRLPIYDSTFGDDETFDLLKKYLQQLSIDECESVQFIADGAPWIWNRVSVLLKNLGVPKSQIIETLDYYHANEHLHDLKDYMDCKDKHAIFNQLKNALWKGDVLEMGELLKKSISNVDLDKFNPYQYFFKNKKRIGYQELRSNKRPCGSGLIESGIRRIINLRFKSPSSFWYPENLEKLIFLRGIALAGRWDIMMKNLYGNEK